MKSKLEWKNDHNKPVYFISNKCSQTIGGVQTKIRLIEEALPQQSFIEIPLVYNQKDIKLEKLPNVEIYSKVTGRKKPKDERRINLFENNNGKIKEKLNPKDSRLIVFGVQKLFFISNKILENNEIIIFQSNRPDVTFGTIESKKVPFILLDKIKYIDKFLFYTEEDKREIMFILNNSKVEYKFKSYVVPNPSKTIRKQISKYTNNLIYMGRFDMIQKNIKEYTRLAERLYPKYKINAYGDGIRKSLLDNSKVNVGGVIKDISQVADQNSILLL